MPGMNRSLVPPHKMHYHDQYFVTMDTAMEIPAGEFKARCLQLMDQVARNREPIVITKRGRPVAKLVPLDEPASREPMFGYMAGSGQIRGDIIDMPTQEWAAISGEEDYLYGDLERPVLPARAAKSTAQRKRRRRR